MSASLRCRQNGEIASPECLVVRKNYILTRDQTYDVSLQPGFAQGGNHALHFGSVANFKYRQADSSLDVVYTAKE